MKIFKKGFTLIEVSLFTAISAALVAGIIISTNSVIDKQEYSGAVRNFVDFIQSVYSEVSNPKNTKIDGGGRTDYSIYGKLITFGEKKSDGAIYTYTVVGKNNDQKGSTITDALKLLSDVDADVIDADGRFYSDSIQNMIWDVDVQNVDGSPFKGAILIARSPASGVIYTYILDANKDENKMINIQEGETSLRAKRLDGKVINEFERKEINFCISPKEKVLYNGNRYEVRLTQYTHDPSGVILYPFDDESNRCRSKD